MSDNSTSHTSGRSTTLNSATKLPTGHAAITAADARLLELWLFGRSPHTQRVYRRDAEHFLAHVRKPLAIVAIDDVQAFASVLAQRHLAPASQARSLAAVKSLLTFAYRIGALAHDPGRAIRLPKRKTELAARILEPCEVHRLLTYEPDRRNRTLLVLLYAGGLRVSEACALTWRDLQPRGANGGQVTVYGKGRKTRVLLLPQGAWEALWALRGDSAVDIDAPVFRSRRGGHLHPVQARRLVAAAAKRAGLPAGVSPHWLRHSHATHALEHGAPIHLVQQTLGHSSIATTGRYLHARPTESSARFLEID